MSNADLADFAADDKGKAVRRLRAVGWVAPALAWALIVVTLAAAVPKFEDVFRDFGVELNVLMKLVIGSSHAWLAVLGVAVVLVVVDSIVRESLTAREGNRKLAGAWSALMFGLPASVIAFMLFALMATLVGLIERLSG